MFKGDETTTPSQSLSFDSNNVLTFTPTSSTGLGRFTKSVQLNSDWECEFKYKVNSGRDGTRIGLQSTSKNTVDNWERRMIGCKNVPEGLYISICTSTNMVETRITESFYDYNVIRITCINNEVSVYVNDVLKTTGTIDWANESLTLGYERWANQNFSLEYFKIKAL